MYVLWVNTPSPEGMSRVLRICYKEHIISQRSIKKGETHTGSLESERTRR